MLVITVYVKDNKDEVIKDIVLNKIVYQDMDSKVVNKDKNHEEIKVNIGRVLKNEVYCCFMSIVIV